MPYIDQTLPVNGYHQKPLIGDAPLPNQPLHDAMPQKVNPHSTEGSIRINSGSISSAAIQIESISMANSPSLSI